jgi:hypothetical protein
LKTFSILGPSQFGSNVPCSPSVISGFILIFSAFWPISAHCTFPTQIGRKPFLLPTPTAPA